MKIKNLKFSVRDPFADIYVNPMYRKLKPGKSAHVKIGNSIYRITRMKVPRA
jgi:hypothetical protein